jgi:hypothetical protein
MHEHAKELKLLYRGTQKEVAQMLAQDHTENRGRLVAESTGEYHLQRCQSAKRTFTEIRI